jgi:Leucine-rich repeat (LRR) protein
MPVNLKLNNLSIMQTLNILLRRSVLALFCSLNLLASAQRIETEAFNGKKYLVYTSLIDANKVHPDSVLGLVLCSNNFKDFPKEILKFKNLKYLNICSSRWTRYRDSLSAEQIRINDSIERKDDITIDYKPNYINKIPKGLRKLKKLEMIDFSSAYVSNNVAYQLFKYAPQALCIPDYKIMLLEKESEKL